MDSTVSPKISESIAECSLCKIKMGGNQNYNSDVRNATKLVRIILTIIGAWPLKNEASIFRKMLRIFVIAICYALLQCVIIPNFFYMIMVGNTARAMLNLMPALLYNAMAITNYTYLLVRKNQIKQCLKHIEEDWNNIVKVPFRDIMKEFVANGRRLLLVCASLIYISGLSFRTILPLTKEKHVNEHNVTIRPLALPGYYHWFDVQATPAYEIVFTLQTLSGFITFSIVSGICGMAIVFVMHICGQLEILIALMGELVTADNSKKMDVDNKLTLLVEHQIRARDFLRLVENTLQGMCLIKIAICTLVTALVGYSIILQWRNRNFVGVYTFVLVLAAIGSILFMFCHIGEQLSVQAENVAVKSAVLDWYRLPEKKARGLVLVMAMSNTPMRMTAGKIFDLSYETFGSIVKTSVAYWQMLITMNE